MTYRHSLIPCLLSITQSSGRRDEAHGQTTRRGAGNWGNRAMISRLLSVGLAAAMVFGLAAEAGAQAGRPSRPGTRKPDQAAAAQEKAAAETDEPAATPAEPSSGPAEDSGTKDGFDQAASKMKGTDAKAGVSPGD